LLLHPEALHGRPGRAAELIDFLQEPDPRRAGRAFYNSLEAPALHKYPILMLFQEFFREQGAVATLMSGSGSTTFAILPGNLDGHRVMDAFSARFGREAWTAVIPLG
jgi:4-diphosphocytidyl-2C-methyl-D-erythritol kinase